MLSGSQWIARRWLWERMIMLKYRLNKPVRIPVPEPSRGAIKAVPVQHVFPSIRLPGIAMAGSIPKDEAKALNHYFYALQDILGRVFGPHVKGLPEVDADPQVRLAEAYGKRKRRMLPAPGVPDAYAASEPDLGSLAVAGPYFGYLTRSDDGRWQWDLRELGRHEHWPGLHNLGCRVFFDVDTESRRLQPAVIDCELGEITPDDSNWPVAQKIALCALTTFTGLVRHFNGVHLAVGGKLGIATRNQLPWDHPLLRLLWPHVYGTQYSNDLATLGQMAPKADFPMVYSFTPAGMYGLFEATHAGLTLDYYDIEAYAERTGLKEAGFEVPSLENLRAIYAVFKQHASSYIDTYYESDEALTADTAVGAWLAELRSLVPGGLPFAGPATRENLARLIATLLYVVIVEHELRGTFLWDYQLWTHVQPIRVFQDGRREPVDVYQRLVNTNMLLNVRRAGLDQDFSYLAIGEKGAQVFKDFQRTLQELQRCLEDGESPRQAWKLYPDMLNANMNA